ncbi:hypothetical protein EOD23_33920 [Mesorhizobium sp. USDA-HM6]|nr:hypothetical protein EOD23_33920 [Mesorhizobium sp. USDA-HM6]
MALGTPSVLPDISPSRGEIWMSHRLSPIADGKRKAPSPKLPISRLEGEMVGRPEGGASRRAVGFA